MLMNKLSPGFQGFCDDVLLGPLINILLDVDLKKIDTRYTTRNSDYGKRVAGLKKDLYSFLKYYWLPR